MGELFVDFLVTKHGLADALQGDTTDSNALHRSFVERLVPVCDDFLRSVWTDSGVPPVTAYAFRRGIGNLCVGGVQAGYQPRELARLLVDGVLRTRS